jgi:hypothetical protein
MLSEAFEIVASETMQGKARTPRRMAIESLLFAAVSKLDVKKSLEHPTYKPCCLTGSGPARKI